MSPDQNLARDLCDIATLVRTHAGKRPAHAALIQDGLEYAGLDALMDRVAAALQRHRQRAQARIARRLQIQSRGTLLIMSIELHTTKTRRTRRRHEEEQERNGKLVREESQCIVMTPNNVGQYPQGFLKGYSALTRGYS